MGLCLCLSACVCGLCAFSFFFLFYVCLLCFWFFFFSGLFVLLVFLSSRERERRCLLLNGWEESLVGGGEGETVISEYTVLKELLRINKK